jgi:hypothetical protein
MVFAQTIIVKLVEPEGGGELGGLAAVLLGALGITGVLFLGAVLLGLVMAGLMFWLRSRT